jgi:DNA-binding NtrC family response regulator
MTNPNDPNKRKPVLLIIESDARLISAINEELDTGFEADCYASLEDASKAYQEGSLWSEPAAAVVEMRENSKEELVRMTNFFAGLPEIPVYLTIHYNCDFQVHEPHLKAWTKRILFRPFDVDKLVRSLQDLDTSNSDESSREQRAEQL